MFAALRSKKSLQASHGLGTWDAQTEIPCLSTRGPQKPVLIWPSMATAAAIGKPADAQRARAETCTRTRPRSCTKRPSGAIATTPTNHPERRLAAAYMRERETVRARAPVISEEIVRLQAQLSEHKKERELRFALHGPIDDKGRPRKSRACELTVRSPARPWPPVSKPTLSLKSTSRETRPETCTF